ncbi:hypothetical protein ACFZB6_24875 [Streptomyces syringium]|uniref:hypothetical protein n=1 Tax=Streptomyces syringium TaxID=76729 RepID=UPI0033C4CD22
MPAPDTTSEAPMPLAAHWRQLVCSWASGHRWPYEADAFSVTIERDAPEAAWKIRLTVTTTGNGLLIVLMTDDRFLKGDQLALAAAAANAWNTHRLVPMLTVFNLTTARPYLAGIRTLPLTCAIPRADFHTAADRWVTEARELFAWCREECRL